MDGAYFCHFHDKLWTPYSSKNIIMLLLVSALIQIAVIDALRVIGGSMTVVQGGTVVLPCKLVDTSEPITQISWERMTRGKPQNEHFFTIVATNGQNPQTQDNRFEFIGSIPDKNGSLKLPNVRLMDEGNYTCIFTLFPSGNHPTRIPLHLLVPPVSSLQDNHLVLVNEEVRLVTCTAAGSRPPAKVEWDKGTLGEKVRSETSSTDHANGTTTTVSSLFGVPTREINNHLVKCIVTSAALPTGETLPFTIKVEFPPSEVKIQKSAEDSFECVTEANPKADFTWTRPGNTWPQSGVRAEGATLHFLSMTSDLNGLYQCEASNKYGNKSGYYYLHVAAGACTSCWTLFCLLLLLNVAVAAVLYLYKAGIFQRLAGPIFMRREAVPTNSRSPTDRQRDQDEEGEGMQPHREVLNL